MLNVFGKVLKRINLEVANIRLKTTTPRSQSGFVESS